MCGIYWFSFPTTRPTSSYPFSNAFFFFFLAIAPSSYSCRNSGDSWQPCSYNMMMGPEVGTWPKLDHESLPPEGGVETQRESRWRLFCAAGLSIDPKAVRSRVFLCGQEAEKAGLDQRSWKQVHRSKGPERKKGWRERILCIWLPPPSDWLRHTHCTESGRNSCILKLKKKKKKRFFLSGRLDFYYLEPTKS